MKTAKKWLIALLVVALFAGACVLGWHLFDTYVDRSGWGLKDGIYHYRDFHGKKVTGWQDIEGSRYYFTPDFAMVTLWQDIDGSRYYFGRDGALDTGWLDIDGSRYHTTPEGILQTGWQDIEGSRYYLGDTGAMVTGWQELAGSTYYFAAEGPMTAGVTQIDGQTYCFGEDGAMQTGQVALSDGIYYFAEDGTMQTGWVDSAEGTSYYLPDTGILQTGWQDIDGSRYYFGEDGLMVTGWLEQGEYSYYLLTDGTMATGKQQIGEYTHYFTPKGIHIVLVNAQHKVPDYYDPQLVNIEGWHRVSDVCDEHLRQMLDDCKAAVGYYEFNSSYRSITDQQGILDARTQENMADGTSYAAARAIALQSVAIPGTSEHHLGLAVDILGTKAIAWLTEHCWEYGFIVRYEGHKSHITGIINEPWHYRYVGIEVSMDMKDSGLCLEEYVGAHPIEVPEEAAPQSEDTATQPQNEP